ncbi:MarR family winged helix-turn-helix transcriptional regulator [Hoeflea sp. TYP-13]|uniref:MarR family winged helix-turn-helix transcriptional regulator n=1 Tax=Hoeflea sp. TYP-13 TaxID=3230023 RepID=UPI0034C62398
MSLAQLDLNNIPDSASLVAVATHRLSRLLRSQLGKVLAECGDISIAEWRIFAGLHQHGAVTQKQLVDFTKIEQGQLSRSLAVMEERNLITSARSDEDRRARFFSMTDKGRDYFERILPSVMAHNQAIDAAFTPRELDQFLEMAGRILQASLDAQSDRTLALSETS